MKLGTAKDRISAYMMGKLEEEEITEEEREMMDRWLNIWNLLNKYHSPAQAVETHIRAMENNGKPISRRTAYRDLRNATDLWGDASKISKRAQLILYQEFAMKAFQVSAHKKDGDAMNKALANLIKLAAMSEDHFDESREAHTYQLVIKTGKGDKTFSLDQVSKMKFSEYEEIIEAVEDDEMSTDEMKSLLERNASDEHQPGV